MNFALILFLLTLVTGILWCVDRFHFRKRRAADALREATAAESSTAASTVASTVAEPTAVESTAADPAAEVEAQ